MNIKEIAKIAGVSPSTVSKIVNQKDDSISAKTRNHVLKIVKEYNYEAYSSVLTSKKTSWTIGVLLQNKLSIHASINGIIETAQENGYNVILCYSNNDAEQELKNITSLCRNNVDGVIWEPVENNLEFAVSEFDKNNIPFIIINQNDDVLPFPYEQLSFDLTIELVSLKHKNIACVVSDVVKERAFIDGFKRCLFEHSIPFNDELIFENNYESLLFQIGTHQISGVISSNYQIATDLYYQARLLHYQIPEDFSLLALKDDSLINFNHPSISSFQLYNTDYGNYLCKHILSKINKTELLDYDFKPETILNNKNTLSVPSNLLPIKIIVVGSINMDTYLNVDQLPNTGKTVNASSFSTYAGGKGINQSIGVSKLGHRVSLIGKVGNDWESNEIYKMLLQHKVDIDGVKKCHEASGKAYIFVDKNGESTISILSGANKTLCAKDILDKEYLFENTGYCLMQTEVPIEAIITACNIAEKYNVKTILKPSSTNRIPLDLYKKINYFIPNLEELFELSPYKNSIETASDFFLNQGVETIIVTLGEKGCFVKTKEWCQYFDAAKIPSIDRTGASDAFISALASYLLYGFELKDAVEIATYAAGFCISREGVVPALIDKASLESHIYQKKSSLLL